MCSMVFLWCTWKVPLHFVTFWLHYYTNSSASDKCGKFILNFRLTFLCQKNWQSGSEQENEKALALNSKQCWLLSCLFPQGQWSYCGVLPKFIADPHRHSLDKMTKMNFNFRSSLKMHRNVIHLYNFWHLVTAGSLFVPIKAVFTQPQPGRTHCSLSILSYTTVYWDTKIMQSCRQLHSTHSLIYNAENPFAVRPSPSLHRPVSDLVI